MYLNIFFTLCIIIGSASGSSVAKREIFYNDFNAEVHSIPNYYGNTQYHHQKYIVPSAAEIAAIITAAKEASASVLLAQQKVHLAKENVLSQQKLANHKHAATALALKQTEAVAAVHRQQASAAANSVIAAQQRLAEAKAIVASHQQKAAEKEAAAAFIIQRAANAAAFQIQKNEKTAAKFAVLYKTESDVALRHLGAPKDITLGLHASTYPWSYNQNVNVWN